MRPIMTNLMNHKSLNSNHSLVAEIMQFNFYPKIAILFNFINYCMHKCHDVLTKDSVETEIFRQIRNAESEIRNIFEIRNSEIRNFAEMPKPFLITFRSKITILKVKM